MARAYKDLTDFPQSLKYFNYCIDNFPVCFSSIQFLFFRYSSYSNINNINNKT